MPTTKAKNSAIDPLQKLKSILLNDDQTRIAELEKMLSQLRRQVRQFIASCTETVTAPPAVVLNISVTRWLAVHHVAQKLVSAPPG